jgi:hypothetical protein
VGLRPLLDELLPVAGDDRPRDREHAAVEVDVAPAEAAHFASPRPGDDGEAEEERQVWSGSRSSAAVSSFCTSSGAGGRISCFTTRGGEAFEAGDTAHQPQRRVDVVDALRAERASATPSGAEQLGVELVEVRRPHGPHLAPTSAGRT